MNIYRVDGIRHQTVAFGATSEEAVAQALASGEVGDWEAPEARLAPLPEGYALRPARQVVELLKAVLEEGWTTLRPRLAGLTDAEFFWEPVPGCWTLHLAEDGRWVEDYADPAPDPPPFTTLAWRVIHVAACKLMYYEYAFGPGQLTWDELVLPHTVADAIAWLEEHHARLRAAMDGLSDRNLDELRLTNWGEPWPTWRIFWVMAAHDLHHGGEIGCLRDLYRAQQSRRMT
jgi:hypothetical protein